MSDEEKQVAKEQRDDRWLLFIDRLMDSFDALGNKIFSGSFLVLIALVGTYCWVAKYIVSSIPHEKITTDFVFGYIAGLASTVMFVLKAYYDKSQKKDDQETKTTSEVKTP